MLPGNGRAPDAPHRAKAVLLSRSSLGDGAAAPAERPRGRLANNHALDYEEWALRETLAVLEYAGIAVTGAGRGSAARCPPVVAAGGARVGLVAFSDHPSEYAARDRQLGIAYVDLRRELPAWLSQTLAELRASCDAVIAFPHRGPNMAPEPQPGNTAAPRRCRPPAPSSSPGTPRTSSTASHGGERADP